MAKGKSKKAADRVSKASRKVRTPAVKRSTTRRPAGSSKARSAVSTAKRRGADRKRKRLEAASDRRNAALIAAGLPAEQRLLAAEEVNADLEDVLQTAVFSEVMRRNHIAAV